ncbi:unnamed protein product [Cunninghamella echinulata]
MAADIHILFIIFKFHINIIIINKKIMVITITGSPLFLIIYLIHSGIGSVKQFQLDGSKSSHVFFFLFLLHIGIPLHSLQDITLNDHHLSFSFKDFQLDLNQGILQTKLNFNTIF